MLAPDENPPMIFPPSALSTGAGQWWVAHTKSRREKALAWGLHQKQIAYFLPMLIRNKVWGGRRRKVLKPMFTSYLFFCGSEENRAQAFATDHLFMTIPVVDQGKFVSELQSIVFALENEIDLEIETLATPGRRVRVARGSFEGLEGTVIQRQGKTRLVLSVTVVGQGTSLEIDADLLEAID